MNTLKSVKAWVSGLFAKKVKPMFDANGVLIADPAGSALSPTEPVVVAAPSEVGAQPVVVAMAAEAPKTVPISNFVDKLEKGLVAMGHELPAYWAEVVALAKKAI